MTPSLPNMTTARQTAKSIQNRPSFSFHKIGSDVRIYITSNYRGVHRTRHATIQAGKQGNFREIRTRCQEMAFRGKAFVTDLTNIA